MIKKANKRLKKIFWEVSTGDVEERKKGEERKKKSNKVIVGIVFMYERELTLAGQRLF